MKSVSCARSERWVGGKIGYRINIIFSHKMKNLWLELFIHGFQGGTVRDTQSRNESESAEREGENLLTITQETDSICHLLRWK